MPVNRFGDTVTAPVRTNRFGDTAGGGSVMSRLAAPTFQDAQRDSVEGELAATASKEQQLGAPFASQGEMRPGGIGEFLLRADLARSNKPEEKIAKLQAARPDFDVQQIDTEAGPRVAFREPGAEAFQAIDRPGGNLMGDVADLGGSMLNLENLAGAGSAVLTGGQGILARLGAAGIMGALGNIGDRKVEDERGFEMGTPEEQKLETGAAAGAAAGGEALGSLLTGAKAMVRGERGLLAPDERAKELLRITGDNPEMGSPSAGQIFPIFKRKENQAAATGNRIADFREEQGIKVANSIKGTVPPDNTDVFSDKALMEAVQQMEADMMASVGEKPGSEAGVRAGGKALEQGRDAYRTGSKEWVDERYKAALAAATPDIKFDISAAQREAQDAIKGVVGKGADKVDIAPPTASPIVGPDGKPFIKPGGEEIVTPGDDVRLAVDFSAPMKSAMDRLTKLDMAVQGNDVSGSFDQIKALRTMFYDLKQPDPQTGTFTNEARIAGKIYSQLTDAMDNPAGGSPDFGVKYKAAGKANKNREEILSTVAYRKIANSENPQQLFKQFADSGDFSGLQLLRRTMPPKDFKKFAGGFEQHLLTDPKSINKTLDGFAKDQSSLRILLPKDRENQLRILGNAAERLADAPARKVLTQTGDVGARAIEIMEKGTDEQFKAYVDAMVKRNPGREKQAKQALLSGSVSKIIDKHKSIKDGRISYNMNKIGTELQQLVESGRLKQVADPALLNALKDRAYVASVLGASASDVGASMHAGAVAQKAVSINPAEATSGALEVLHNDIWARILTSPKTVKVLAGAGTPGTPKLDRGLKLVSSLMGIASDDISNASDLNFVEDEPTKAKKPVVE